MAALPVVDEGFGAREAIMNKNAVVDCWISRPGTYFAAIVYHFRDSGYRASVLEKSAKIAVVEAPSLNEMKRLLESRYPAFSESWADRSGETHEGLKSAPLRT
jgi:hypothetical protein